MGRCMGAWGDDVVIMWCGGYKCSVILPGLVRQLGMGGP